MRAGLDYYVRHWMSVPKLQTKEMGRWHLLLKAKCKAVHIFLSFTEYNMDIYSKMLNIP